MSCDCGKKKTTHTCQDCGTQYCRPCAEDSMMCCDCRPNIEED